MYNMNKLSTIVFTRGHEVISPPLTTAREYGRWLECVFDEYTCNYELYLKSTFGDDIVLERHPGTRIGQYFDNTDFNNLKYGSWYVYQQSTMMEKLNKLKLAEYKDIARVRSKEKEGLKLLRLYSIDQIELYVRTKIDRNFNITNKFLQPKKIALKNHDMSNIIIPHIRKSRRSLFEEVSTPVSMTVHDIERKLGYKISIVS